MDSNKKQSWNKPDYTEENNRLLLSETDSNKLVIDRTVFKKSEAEKEDLRIAKRQWKKLNMH